MIRYATIRTHSGRVVDLAAANPSIPGGVAASVEVLASGQEPVRLFVDGVEPRRKTPAQPDIPNDLAAGQHEIRVVQGFEGEPPVESKTFQIEVRRHEQPPA